MGGRNPPASILLQYLALRWGGICERCGQNHELQFAHTQETKLKGRGRGSRERYYDARRHPECYMLLCGECHDLVDRGLILIYPPDVSAL